MLLLLACHAQDASSFAGLTVTTRTFDADGTAVSQHTETYDEDAHVVSWSEDSATRHVEGTDTWVNGCRAEGLETQFHLEFDETETTTYTGICDDAGNYTRLDREYVDVTDDVETRIASTYTYENTYDADGRLVRVAQDVDGKPWQVRLYGWGDCENPTLSSYENAGGDSGVTALTCRRDGQTDESSWHAFDADGSRAGTGRARHGYDRRGHVVLRIYDGGPETEEIRRLTYDWDDLSAPGPTSGTWEEAGELAQTWTVTYE